MSNIESLLDLQAKDQCDFDQCVVKEKRCPTSAAFSYTDVVFNPATAKFIVKMKPTKSPFAQTQKNPKVSSDE